MPIEIKELHVKVTVSDNTHGAQSQTNNGSGANSSAGATPQSGGDTSAIVQECVDKVLEILKNKIDR